jgi:hypothetical protein
LFVRQNCWGQLDRGGFAEVRDPRMSWPSIEADGKDPGIHCRQCNIRQPRILTNGLSYFLRWCHPGLAFAFDHDSVPVMVDHVGRDRILVLSSSARKYRSRGSPACVPATGMLAYERERTGALFRENSVRCM